MLKFLFHSVTVTKMLSVACIAYISFYNCVHAFPFMVDTYDGFSLQRTLLWVMYTVF